MTHNEFPETPRGMLETDALGPSDAQARTDLVSTSAAPGFASRREMREAGGYGSADQHAVAKKVRPVKLRRRSGRPRDIIRARLATSNRPQWRRRLSSAGVMAVVVGLFATVTLPAFAEQNTTLALTTGPLDRQTYEVAAAADASAFIRDGYETTSASDLRKLYADAVRQQNLAAYLASGARELGDDYPWPDMLSRAQGGGLSPLNYYYRECVDFVAWRLNRDAGSTSAPFTWVWSNLAQGSAHAWKSAWERKGWVVSATPVAGSVAYFPGANHVAYVSGILADGSVALEEYNWSIDHGYSQRVIPPSGAIYLYPPG